MKIRVIGDLINCFSSLAASNPKVVITHGEYEQRKTLSDLLKKKFGVKPVLPKLNEIVEL